MRIEELIKGQVTPVLTDDERRIVERFYKSGTILEGVENWNELLSTVDHPLEDLSNLTIDVKYNEVHTDYRYLESLVEEAEIGERYNDLLMFMLIAIKRSIRTVDGIISKLSEGKADVCQDPTRITERGTSEDAIRREILIQDYISYKEVKAWHLAICDMNGVRQLAKTKKGLTSKDWTERLRHRVMSDADTYSIAEKLQEVI